MEQLFDVLKPFLAEKHPFKLYATAYRDVVEESQKCGCLVCYSIFDKSEIIVWIEYPENDEIEADLGEILGREYDIAVCPTCNLHNGVMADQSLTVITVSEMEKCNAEFESNLRDDMKTARQELRKTTRQKLGLS